MSVLHESFPPGSPTFPERVSVRLSDGYETSYRLWRTDREPRGLIIGLHGIQSHAGWYGASSMALSNSGFAVAFVDRRGSGASTAQRGDAPHLERLVNDLVQVTAHLDREGFAGTPKTLLAISWGGKLAALTVARRPDLFQGLILLAPGLCTRVRANRVQQAALRTADALGAGNREIAIPLDDPALFSDIKEFQDFIREDPLTLRRVTVRFPRISLDTDREVRASADRIRCPTLLVLAGKDRIVDNVSTRQLVESFGADEKTVIEFPESCHTFEFDRDRNLVVERITA